MVKMQDGLIFAGALSLWMADRVVEQAMTARGRTRLAVGSGCAVMGLVGLLYITTGHLWASSLPLASASFATADNSMSLVDTPALLNEIEHVKLDIRAQRQKLHRSQTSSQDHHSTEVLAMLSSSIDDHVLTGRSDPFEPLIKAPILTTPGMPASGFVKPKPIDPMTSVSFAGTVGDADSANAVGIFKLNDPQRGMVTQIKRIGENVELPNGQIAQLRAVGRSSAELLFNGQLRTVSLLSYDDADASTKTAPVMTAQPSAGSGSGKSPIINLGGFKE